MSEFFISDDGYLSFYNPNTDKIVQVRKLTEEEIEKSCKIVTG